jgi:hypothetical protein
MKVDSLEDLASAFGERRQAKKHAREPAPDQLLARARRAVKEHGLTSLPVGPDGRMTVAGPDRWSRRRTRPAPSRQGSAVNERAMSV